MSDGYGAATVIVHPGRETHVSASICAGANARVKHFPGSDGKPGFISIDQDRVGLTIALPSVRSESDADFLRELAKAVTSLLAETQESATQLPLPDLDEDPVPDKTKAA
ncbi:hypothetical protein [Herbidospora sp. NBRC 101105]|uniref:hypothetical protein n=1 Tax=Herbidospora sp. NBRC 101105 TaxID=3032195 RepID=UPI0024A4E799|nr:hypothetical protein [Herbidospora sp. NBRC 101105]GLX95877.1 hypothetical protein Hesp01_38270 [Herbidospora sp. NBRC 101105]